MVFAVLRHSVGWWIPSAPSSASFLYADARIMLMTPRTRTYQQVRRMYTRSCAAVCSAVLCSAVGAILQYRKQTVV